MGYLILNVLHIHYYNYYNQNTDKIMWFFYIFNLNVSIKSDVFNCEL